MRIKALRIVGLFLVLLVSTPLWAGQNSVTKIRIKKDSSRKSAAQVKIFCSQAPVFQVFEAIGPNRVVVEMLDTAIGDGLTKKLPAVPPIKRVTYEYVKSSAGAVARLHFVVAQGVLFDVRAHKNTITLQVYHEGDADIVTAEVEEEQRRIAEAAKLVAEKKKAQQEARTAEKQRLVEQQKRHSAEQAVKQTSRQARRLEEEKRKAEEAARQSSLLAKKAQAEKLQAEKQRRLEEEKRIAEEQRRLEVERQAALEAQRAKRQAAQKEAAAREAEKKRLLEEKRRQKAEQQAKVLTQQKRQAEAAAKKAEQEKRKLQQQQRAEKKAAAEEKSRAVEQQRKSEQERRRLQLGKQKAEQERQQLLEEKQQLAAEKKKLTAALQRAQQEKAAMLKQADQEKARLREAATIERAEREKARLRQASGKSTQTQPTAVKTKTEATGETEAETTAEKQDATHAKLNDEVARQRREKQRLLEERNRLQAEIKELRKIEQSKIEQRKVERKIEQRKSEQTSPGTKDELGFGGAPAGKKRPVAAQAPKSAVSRPPVSNAPASHTPAARSQDSNASAAKARTIKPQAPRKAASQNPKPAAPDRQFAPPKVAANSKVANQSSRFVRIAGDSHLESGYGGGSYREPTPIRAIRCSQRGSGSKLSINVPGGARYSLQRRNDKTLVITLRDTIIYELKLLRSLDLRRHGGAVRYVVPEVEGGSRSHVNIVVEHRRGMRVRTGSDGDTLSFYFDPA